jgi:hypothetical protein
VVSVTSRNSRCPCGSGRKFKRCCAELAETVSTTALAHADVGKRIQAWAGEHHRDALDAAWAQITDGRELALGEVDVQLIADWIFNDRELAGGATAAELYSRLDDLDPDERDIARRIAGARLGLMSVGRVAPGLWIELEDHTRRDFVRVISCGVSAHVSQGDLIVARRMEGPPTPSLWGPVGFVSAEIGPRLSSLIDARIALLGLDDGSEALATAMHNASMEITILLSPALRRPGAGTPSGVAAALSGAGARQNAD